MAATPMVKIKSLGIKSSISCLKLPHHFLFLYILFNSPVKTLKILQFKYFVCDFLLNLQSQHISRAVKSLTKNYKADCHLRRQESKANM